MLLAKIYSIYIFWYEKYYTYNYCKNAKVYILGIGNISDEKEQEKSIVRKFDNRDTKNG